ncbi:MAG TPA: hypothetical protein VGM63_00315 [Mucilaginibacter sp.]|jgi:hypothetical protein
MKKLILPLACLFVVTSLSGCGLMEDAFKAGFVIALILAALVGLLIWIFHFSYKLLGKYFPAIRVFEGFWDE